MVHVDEDNREWLCFVHFQILRGHMAPTNELLVYDNMNVEGKKVVCKLGNYP